MAVQRQWVTTAFGFEGCRIMLVAYLDLRFDGLRQELVAKLDAMALETRRHAEAGATETRRHFDVVAEHLNGKIQALAEGLEVQDEKADRRHAEVWSEITGLGHRLTHLQARILRPPER